MGLSQISEWFEDVCYPPPIWWVASLPASALVADLLASERGRGHAVPVLSR